MEFEDAEGVESSAGQVTRTMAGSGWNVGATSKRAITKIGDEVRGVSADCDQTDKSMMIGLNSGSTNSVDEVVDFGIVCDNGVIRISEHGVVRDGDFGDYFVGETFQVVVLDSGVVTYYKDGAAFATSDEAPAFPLYATARFNTAGASFSRVSWIQTVHEGANDLDLIEWVGLSQGMTTDGKQGYLKRTEGGNNWARGAYSARAITKVGDEIRGISGDCMRTDNRHLQFGLSSTPSGHSQTTIDYAVFCNGNQVRFQEKGVNKFDAGVFVAGETFQVIVNDAGAIEFYVDGDLKYTSLTAPSFPLYADTSFHNHLAELANARWVHKVVKGANDLAAMEFEDAEGVESSAGQVTRTMAGSGWNVGATSKRAITKIGDEVRGVSADCDQTDKSMMIGLNSGSTNSVDEVVDFGIVCDNGVIRISEHGVVRDGDFGDYFVGETFQVVVLDSGVVTYYKDGAAFATSDEAPAFPLYATARFNTAGASFSRVSWIQTVHEGANDLDLIEWVGLSQGMTTDGKQGYLKRTEGGNNWARGAYSARAITKVGDEIRGISGDCMRTDNRHLQFGLSSTPSGHSQTTIDYAVFCNGNQVRFQEKGVNKFDAGVFVAGETFQVIVNDAGAIEFYVDGDLKYTSLTAPSFPLYADTSFHNHLAELANARWVHKVVKGANDLAAMEFEDAEGVESSAGQVTRTMAGSGWNVGATSKRAITKIGDEVRGVSADCDQTDKSMMIGLNSGSTNSVDEVVDFGIVCDNGVIRISEHGVVRDGDFGDYFVGETFQVVVLDSGVVTYYKDGAAFATSDEAPAFPLYATARFNTAGASFSRVSWIQTVHEGANDLDLIEWVGLSQGMTTDGKQGYLKRTEGGNNWARGAYSARAITKVGDEIRGISGDCMRTDNRHLQFGLSSTPSGHSQTTIDYAVFCNGNQVRFQEKGVNKFDAGVFVAGETFQVIVNDAGAIEFYVDGDLKYTSLTAPSFPLYADTSFHNHLAELANARWVHKVVKGANDLAAMEFEDAEGVESSAGQVTRTMAGSGWNVGATSKRAITKIGDEVRGVSADCDQTDKSMMIGLNSGSTNSVDEVVDFGIVCDNGVIRISEHGVVRDGDFGDYFVGETFQVVVLDSGVVTYYKDGAAFATSDEAPAFPLYATARFNTAGASFSRVSWIQTVHEGANDLDLIEWVGLSQGMTTDGKQGYLKRTEGGNNWARGAYSARAITKVGDEIRGISGDCMRTDNRHLQFGLSSTPSGHSQTTIDYAVFCNGNQVRFQEKGVNKFDAGVFVAGETFQVIVNDAGAIEFYVDGDLKYTSLTAPSFPLYADTSFHNHLAELANARWVHKVVKGANDLAAMEFEDAEGVESSAGQVTRTMAGSGWNVGATSKRAITKIGDEVRGVSADCDQTDKSMMIGLNSGSTNSVDEVVDFGIVCDNGVIRISEHGVVRDGDFGDYFVGETFQVVVLDSGVVTYYKDGAAFATSDEAPAFPLYATARFNTAGASFSRVSWIQTVHEGANDLDLIEWVGLSQGMTTDGKQGYLKRTEGGNNWARGAYSARAITKVGDEIRGISGDCMRTDNRHLQFGLSSTPSGHSQTTIDYAVFCNGNQVRFQEKGVNKFDAGVFVAGETFQVIVNDAGAIEFYVDGDLKYTSLTAPSFPLYADTSFHNHLAELANARWVHKVVKGANDLAAMEFEDAEGVESSAGQVTRTMAGSGWNVGATSKRAITKIGDEVRGVSADCDQTDKSMMIGLNSGSTNSVDEVVDFGIVCDNGVIRISEHGVVRDGDFGDYFVGETFQVVVLDSGVVTYYKDGAAFATSDEAPAFPLYATARFNTAGASFSRVSWIQTVHEGANDLDLIEWVGLSQGMTTDGKQGYLKRTQGGNNWARGAYSARAITKVGDEVRGISGDCMRTDNRHLQFGLSSTPSGHSQTTIDYAVFCNGNQVRFQEKGVNKFDAGVFVAGETFQVIVNDAGAIEFYVDGDLKYTSLTSPSFPLYADTSFHNHLAELANARWVHKVVKGANDLAAMEFEDAEGVESSAGQVTRTMAGSGWNVGATSKRAITKIGDEVRGVSADCDQTDKSMMIGLNSGSTNSVDEVVDFGIVCDNGVIRISEHGVVRDGDFGDYFVGETFQVVVLDSGVVTYYKDGAAFATSDEAPAFPLYATARFNTAGASFSRVSWIQTVHEGANDLDLIEWVGLSQGMTTDGKQGYLKRTEGGNNWARGAYSARAITKVGDEIRGISGDCMRTDNRHLQFGLSSTPSGHSQTTIDYAVFCNGNQVRFQEKGVNKFDAGVFVAGETFQVIVNDAGAIEFYVDGDLKYTSLTSPSFPLYADTSFHNHLAELANARWVHKVVKGANDLAAMEFEDAEGVESSAGQVTRTMAGSGWNVGATSKRAITKIGDEVRGVSADCDQTDKSMMIGLNSGSTNSVDEVVDFGIVCDNGVIRISEHGVVRDGDFGDYFVGETFQVVVLDSGVVTYYKDGAAFATSDEAPAFPLYATARFNRSLQARLSLESPGYRLSTRVRTTWISSSGSDFRRA